MEISNYSNYIKKAIEILPKGAFLTTKSDDKINTMTIGWAAFGFQWGIPTVEVMVRESRFTKAMIDDSMEFTITFPCDDSMKSELSFCGIKSGKDTDKIKECNIELLPSEIIETPAVYCKGIIFECKVVSAINMTSDTTNEEIADKWYKNNDFHTIYHAKVVNCREI